jgi:hypothetical protein
MPLAAFGLCCAAICSTNAGADKIFLTKDLFAMFFEEVSICGQKALWWLAG